MRHFVPWRLALTLPVLLAASVALAAPTVQVLPVKDGARLLLGGRLVTVFRTPNGLLSPQERAELAAERLRKALEDGLKPGGIEARARGEAWGVYAGGTLVMVATPDEAAERKEEPEVTARRWAANLKTVLADVAPAAKSAARPAKPREERVAHAVKAKKPAQPAKEARAAAPPEAAPEPPTLGVNAEQLVVPAGETRTLALRGTARGQLAARTEDQDTATARAVPGKALVEVRGVAPGKTIVHVERDGKDAAFAVFVKKSAGRVGEMPSAVVTGTLAPAEYVRRIAAERMLDGVQRETGAVVRVAGPAEGVRPLARGQSAEVVFPVAITGEGYLPVRASVRVRVRNVQLPAQETRLLLYSNDPETVKQCGSLYQGLIETGGAARLLYHHQNGTGRPFVFQVHLLNPGPEPAEVHVIEGDAGPFVDAIQVGHRAGHRYLDAATKGIGYVTRIPARGARTIYTTNVPHDDVVSGIYGLRILTGGPVVAQVAAQPGPTLPTVRAGLLETAREEPNTYPTPEKDERYQYTCGEHWTFVPLGRKAITAKDPNRKLFGNYGVLYNITVDLNNPSDEEKTVRILLNPEAGWARGVFLIEGKLVEAPQIAPPGEAVLWTVRLAPQEQRRVSIRSIPVGGSSYPVSIVVRS